MPDEGRRNNWTKVLCHSASPAVRARHACPTRVVRALLRLFLAFHPSLTNFRCSLELVSCRPTCAATTALDIRTLLLQVVVDIDRFFNTPRPHLFLEIRVLIRQRLNLWCGYRVMPVSPSLFTAPKSIPSLVLDGLKQTCAVGCYREFHTETVARTERAFERAHRRGTCSATPLLRLRCARREEAHRRAALRTSQSRAARFGCKARGLVVEQHPTRTLMANPARFWWMRSGKLNSASAKSPDPNGIAPTRETATGGASTERGSTVEVAHAPGNPNINHE